MGFIRDDATARVHRARGQPCGRKGRREQGGCESLAVGRDFVSQRRLRFPLGRQALEQLDDLASRARDCGVEARRLLPGQQAPGDLAVSIELALHTLPRPADIRLAATNMHRMVMDMLDVGAAT